MIIYENKNRLFSTTKYDTTYSINPEHFSHRVTFWAIEQVFNKYLTLEQSFSCMDLGCGQGQVLAKVYTEIEKGNPKADFQLYGIDISKTAIDQCNKRYPDFFWIIDSFQDFLENDKTIKLYSNQFDLVINKGGLTHVQSQQDYKEMLSGINYMLKEKGKYIFIQNKKFYQKWSNTHCQNWSKDIFDIACNVFGQVEIIRHNSYYINIYSKGDFSPNNKSLASQHTKPISVDFFLNNGQTQSYYISGDELTYQYLNQLIEAPNKTEPFVYDVPSHLTEKSSQRQQKLVQRTVQSFVANQERVLLADSPPWLTRKVFKMLEKEVNFIHFPEQCDTSRKCCDFVNSWLAAQPDLLIFGFSLKDFKLDRNTNKPMVDLDEFRYRLDFVIDKLTTENKIQLVLISPGLFEARSQIKKAVNNWSYDFSNLKSYETAIRELCVFYNIEYLDVNVLLNKNGDGFPKAESLDFWQNLDTKLAKLVTEKIQKLSSLEQNI